MTDVLAWSAIYEFSPTARKGAVITLPDNTGRTVMHSAIYNELVRKEPSG